MSTVCSCINCKELVTTNNISKHYTRCLEKGGKFTYSSSLDCEFCNRKFELASAAGLHRIQCDQNPNRIFRRTDSSWNRGHTKETDARVKQGAENFKARYAAGEIELKSTVWSDEQREAARKKQSENLRINSHKYRRGKKSWMESVFQEWLIENSIPFRDEVHFYNSVIDKNYFVDFLVDSAKVIIEIDGNHHEQEKIKQSDVIRDKYLTELGYTVIRISYKTFKLYNWKQDLYGRLV